MREPNPKIVGSVLVGFAIVAAAYVTSNFGQPGRPITGSGAAIVTNTLPARTAITVVDTNNNNIEDWREEFLVTQPIILPTSEATPLYEPPRTVTGQMALRFFEDTISTRNFGPFAPTNSQVIEQTLASVEPIAFDTIIDTNQITIIDVSDQAIYNYANALMQIVIDNNQPGVPDELTLLEAILRDPSNQVAAQQLAEKGVAYSRMRDMTMRLPVPRILAKQHLDLLNSYNAIARNIDAMTNALNDPIVSLLRIKRFEDDATGLFLSFRNMFLSLEPHAALFSIDDPAVLLVAFSPNLQ